MQGSRDSIAPPNVVINTIVAEAFCEACDELEKAGDFNEAVHDMIKENLVKHQRVIFNGNGYSERWVREAKRRGLPNLRSMVDAIPELTRPETIAMYEKFGVFNEAELRSRAEVKYENYAKSINIEARTMIQMASKDIIPAVSKYNRQLAETIIAIKDAGAGDASVETDRLNVTSRLLKEARDAMCILKDKEAKAIHVPEGEEQARYYHNEIVPAMEALRAPVDELELLVDREMWPMPSYGDILFKV